MGSNILRPDLHLTTDQFHWSKKEKTFSAECSELRINDRKVFPVGGFWKALSRAYNDACDLGFTLVSQKTGKELTMVVDKIDRSEDYSEGFRFVEFVPADRGYKERFKVVIFNG
jgi:hypothetical protein